VVAVTARVPPAAGALVRRERVADPSTQRALDGISLLTQQARQCPLVDGALLRSISLTTAGANVAHSLGRAWTGYIVTRSSSGAAVFDAGAQRDSTRFVSLQSSSNVVVDLWVF
jgi:hypothetical protein